MTRDADGNRPSADRFARRQRGSKPGSRRSASPPSSSSDPVPTSSRPTCSRASATRRNALPPGWTRPALTSPRIRSAGGDPTQPDPWRERRGAVVRGRRHDRRHRLSLSRMAGDISDAGQAGKSSKRERRPRPRGSRASTNGSTRWSRRLPPLPEGAGRNDVAPRCSSARGAAVASCLLLTMLAPALAAELSPRGVSRQDQAGRPGRGRRPVRRARGHAAGGAGIPRRPPARLRLSQFRCRQLHRLFGQADPHPGRHSIPPARSSAPSSSSITSRSCSSAFPQEKITHHHRSLRRHRHQRTSPAGTAAASQAVDIVSGATVTVLVIGDSILRSALKVAQARGLGQPAAAVAGTAAVATHDRSRQERASRTGRRCSATARCAGCISASPRSTTPSASRAMPRRRPSPEKGPPDDTFIDLYVALASDADDRPQPARRGRLRRS